MDRCPVAGCFELKPVSAKSCGKHGKSCTTEGCDGFAGTAHNSLFCPKCRKVRNSHAQRMMRELMAEALTPPEDWKPKEKPAPIMTWAEQHAIDDAVARKESQRLNAIHEAMGLKVAKGRPLASDPISLPPDRIAELSKLYTPPKGGKDYWPRGVDAQAGG